MPKKQTCDIITVVMKMANKRYELTDEQWERVRGLIIYSKMGWPPKDDRVMLNAMLWVARSGAGWKNLSEQYGPWKTVYSRFCKWPDDGTFPQKNNEIIVSRSYAENRLHTAEYSACVGRTVQLAGSTYVIAGVLSELAGSDQQNLVYCNSYYQKEDALNLVFIPYKTLQKRGREVPEKTKMVRLDGLYENPAYYQSLRADLDGSVSMWDTMILDAEEMVQIVFYVILAVVTIAAAIALLFLKSEIQLELYYRRKEIGYLQVFHVTKKRVRNMLLGERLLRSGLSLAIAFLCFILCSIWIKLQFGVNVLLPIHLIVLFLLFYLAYILAVFWFPCSKFLKKDIISLLQ